MLGVLRGVDARVIILDPDHWSKASAQRKPILLWSAIYGTTGQGDYVPTETPEETRARIRERWARELERRRTKSESPKVRAIRG